MKFEILFYCSVCKKYVEGRFCPVDEAATLLSIVCEICRNVVGMNKFEL